MVVSSCLKVNVLRPSGVIPMKNLTHNGETLISLWYNEDMDNAVGSLELQKILRVRKNLKLEITDRQREILIGCILGDAHIQKLGKIIIEQSAKQEDYLLWKYSELKNLCYPAKPAKIIRIDKRNNKKYYSNVFYLNSISDCGGKYFIAKTRKCFQIIYY